MDPAITILPENIITGQTNLFGEVSEEGFSYILQDDKDKKITGLCVYYFSKNDKETGITIRLKKTLDEGRLFTGNFNKTVISYAFNECTLVPAKYYNPDKNIENIHLLFGDLREGIILAGHVAEKNLYTVYRVPGKIYEVITAWCPAATFVHQYAAIAKQLPLTGVTLNIIFYQHKIVAALVIEDKLQIIQTFFYVTAQDVVYHMLNICHQFKTNDANVYLSGVIEKDSALSRELHACFSNISFAGLPRGFQCVEEIKQFPEHFFRNLYSLALCE